MTDTTTEIIHAVSTDQLQELLQSLRDIRQPVMIEVDAGAYLALD